MPCRSIARSPGPSWRAGRFRSLEVILGYVAAFNAGDGESRIGA